MSDPYGQPSSPVPPPPPSSGGGFGRPEWSAPGGAGAPPAPAGFGGPADYPQGPPTFGSGPAGPSGGFEPGPTGGGGSPGPRRWLIPAIIALLIGGGVGLYFLTQGDDDEDAGPPAPTAPGPVTSAPAGQDSPTLTMPELGSLPNIDFTVPDITIPDLTFPSVNMPAGAPVPEPTQEPTGLGSDPALDALAQSCYDGDMKACDDLYDQADVDSAYETYGDTCAGRQPTGTLRYCTSSFSGFASPDRLAPPADPAATTTQTTDAVGVQPAMQPIDTTPPEDTTSGDGIPEPTQEPTGLGRDPEMDALAESCYDGDMADCDTLYQQSPVASRYEAYGDSCAGRQPEGTSFYCVDAFGASTTIPTTVTQADRLGDDPTLDALAVDCYDGDMQACDDLFMTSPSDSEYETYGDTCAGRQPAGGPRYCVDAFGSDPPPPDGDRPTVGTGGPTDTTGPTESTESTETTDPTSDTISDDGVLPEPTMEPDALGTDPALDALAERCYDGDLSSCDELYLEAVAGSQYEEFGDTCAGRNPDGGIACVVVFADAVTTSSIPDDTAVDVTGPDTTSSDTTNPDVTTPDVTGPDITFPDLTLPGGPTGPIPAGEKPVRLGNDPQLDLLAEDCYGGDMDACDDLYFESPEHSAYETYGDTCGGRQPEGTRRYCSDVFG